MASLPQQRETTKRDVPTRRHPTLYASGEREFGLPILYAVSLPARFLHSRVLREPRGGAVHFQRQYN